MMKTIRMISRKLSGLHRESQQENAEDLKNLYFRYATDYYVAGRFAFFARSTPHPRRFLGGWRRHR